MPYKDKEKEREYRKKYEQEHKEEINARRRLNQNKKEYNRKYREEHRDEINAKQNVKFICPCGSSYFKRHQATHIKTKKHVEYLEKVEIEPPPKNIAL